MTEQRDGATSHRRPGPAAVDSPSTSRWREADPRSALLCYFFLPAMSWGLLTADSARWRLLGATAGVLTVVAIASYTLRFFPKVLRHEWWSRTQSRRAARLTLLWAWLVILLGLVTLMLIVALVDWVS